MKLFIIALFTLLIAPQTEDSGTLVIEITNIKNTNGHILVSLYDNAEGFPSEANRAIKNMKLDIKGETVTTTIDDLPYDTYAISLIHDEDDNEQMKTGFMGIPKEGYGTSNNAKGTMGPPKFEDAKFKVNGKRTVQSIKVNY